MNNLDTLVSYWVTFASGRIALIESTNQVHDIADQITWVREETGEVSDVVAIEAV